MPITVLSDVILSNAVLSAGVRGKNVRLNNRIRTENGEQSINIVWSQSLREYELGTVPLRVEDWEDIAALHEITEGGAYGFLMEDPADNTVSNGSAAFISEAIGYQLQKRYVDARSGRYKDRPITRPRASGFILYVDGVALSAGSYTLNVNTGTVIIPSLPAASSVSWDGQFYVPVHFRDDAIDWDLVVAGAKDTRFLAGPLVVLSEIREYQQTLAGVGTSAPIPSDLGIDAPPAVPAPYTPGVPAPNPSTDPSVDVVLEFSGDSIVWGYSTIDGSQVATTIPERVQAVLPHYTVNNRGYNSTSTDDILNGTGEMAGYGVGDWNDLVTAWAGTHVIISHGVNDASDGRNEADYKSNLTAMATQARAAGLSVLFMTPIPTTNLDTSDYATWMTEAAEALDAPVIDVHAWAVAYMAANSITQAAFTPDGIHPTDAMYIQIGSYVASQLPALITPAAGEGNAGDVFPTGVAGNWVLTFQDEFAGSALDSSKWNTEIWYGDNDGVAHTTQNYDVTGGTLRIWPYKHASGRWMRRTIDTDGKFYQTYGFFEARLRLPVGKGLWPAFWLLNHDTDSRPEIDIMEAYSGGTDASDNPGWATDSYHPINAGMTVHHTLGVVAGGFTTAGIVGEIDLSANYYRYGVEWRSDGKCQFYFEGEPVGPLISLNSSRRMYVLLDLWYGSASGNPTDADTPTGSSNSYLIDYVRVWQRG